MVGIALKCESGDSLGMNAAAAKACLEPSVVYFRSRNKEALATSIEHLIEALERGTDVQVRGAEVMQSLNGPCVLSAIDRIYLDLLANAQLQLRASAPVSCKPQAHIIVATLLRRGLIKPHLHRGRNSCLRTRRLGAGLGDGQVVSCLTLHASAR